MSAFAPPFLTEQSLETRPSSFEPLGTVCYAKMDTNKSEPILQAEEAFQVETVRLHPEADATLVVHGDATSAIRKEFLVSSSVLSVTSDYFKALFRSGFKEGLETQRGDYPTIFMGEDDPEAMEAILSLLHYRNLEVYDNPKRWLRLRYTVINTIVRELYDPGFPIGSATSLGRPTQTNSGSFSWQPISSALRNIPKRSLLGLLEKGRLILSRSGRSTI